MILTTRAKLVLEEIVHQYIINGVPVSSTLIAQKSKLNMSPATIRSIMAELEKQGYIYQPHTSAGRVPRTLGYRAYVDTMMKRARLSSADRDTIRDSIQPMAYELDEVLKEVTRIIACLSQQLSVIVSPKLEQGIFDRMELISLSSAKVLVVITIESGLIKTITLEIDSLISREKLVLVGQILNERLHGMKIADIRQHFSHIVRDIRNEDSGLVKLFTQKVDHLFDFREENEIYFMGAHNMLLQQEFATMETISSVVEMLENGKIVVHLLDNDSDNDSLKIKIGEEIEEKRIQECSIITAKYTIGNIKGIMGVIGPTRMNYSKMVSLVDFTARTLTSNHSKN